jgi:uncharacterized membrane protein YjgN (DUF898 family)
VFIKRKRGILLTVLSASGTIMPESSQKLASYYDGSSIEMALFKLLGFIITICTLGIAYPWVLVMIYGKKISNTVIEGRRLQFNGSAIGLFGMWIKWWFFSVITLGIYTLFIATRLERWRVSHTSFAK